MEKSKGSSLGKGEFLSILEYLESENKLYRLVLQEDGNLVIYSTIKKDLTSKRALWATSIFNKDGRVIDILRLQHDGNLVLYFQGEKDAVWATKTNNGNRLVMQNDGNLVLYKDDGHAVWASNSRDTSNWMVGLDGNLTLKDICMPGSHDAGMYETTQKYAPGLALTQGESVGKQLERGIRYFDFRLQYFSDNVGDDRFYIYHGVAKGPLFTKILSDIKFFFESGSMETVILSFSHLKDFPNIENGLSSEKYDFIKLIHKYIGMYMLSPNDSNIYFNEIPVSRLRGKIIITLDGFNEGEFDIFNAKYTGFYRDFRNYITDAYANTKYYERMLVDQMSKYGKFNDKNKLFLLNWTLTPDDGFFGGVKAVTQSYTSVKTYAEEINPRLTDWGHARDFLFKPNFYGYMVNIINGDFWSLTGSNVLDACFEVMNNKKINQKQEAIRLKNAETQQMIDMYSINNGDGEVEDVKLHPADFISGNINQVFYKKIGIDGASRLQSASTGKYLSATDETESSWFGIYEGGRMVGCALEGLSDANQSWVFEKVSEGWRIVSKKHFPQRLDCNREIINVNNPNDGKFQVWNISAAN